MYVPGSGNLEQGLSIGVDLKLAPFCVSLMHDQIISRPCSARWLVYSINPIHLQGVIKDGVLSTIQKSILALITIC